MTHLTLESIGGTGHGQRAWVAEITGTDPKFGFKREFLSGQRDYSDSNRPGTRGIETTYWLEEGKIYEISAPLSWKNTDRYFATIRDGQQVRLRKNEIMEALRAQVAA